MDSTDGLDQAKDFMTQQLEAYFVSKGIDFDSLSEDKKMQAMSECIKEMHDEPIDLSKLKRACALPGADMTPERFLQISEMMGAGMKHGGRDNILNNLGPMAPGYEKYEDLRNDTMKTYTKNCIKSGRTEAGILGMDSNIYCCQKCNIQERDLTGGGKLLKCGRCFHAYYCSKECQKSHWKTHKINCHALD